MSTIKQRPLLVPIQGSAARAHNKGLAQSPSSHTAMVLGCIQGSLSNKTRLIHGMCGDWWKEGVVDCSDTVARENFHLQCSSLPDTLLQSGVGRGGWSIAQFAHSHGGMEICGIPCYIAFGVGMQAPKTAFIMPRKENILPLPQGCSYKFRSFLSWHNSAALGLPILLSESTSCLHNCQTSNHSI